MVNISAALVKELRDSTNVGMMECKRALIEAGGDKARAIIILRERGMAIAEKKTARAAKQGIIDSVLLQDGQTGSMIEVNCETDFVARNETFKSFVRVLTEKAATIDETLSKVAADDVRAKIAEIGENIVIRRNIRYVLEGTGVIAAYIHHGNTIGVLTEIGCQKSETVASNVFKELSKDICLHIAASNPKYLDSNSIQADVIEVEQSIYAKQVKNKPANIINKIVEGKMQKFYQQVCLLNQLFVKDQEKTIADLLKEKGIELNDILSVRRFVRFQVGEAF